MKDEKTVVEEAKDRFKLAKEAHDELRQLASKDTDFFLGDSDNQGQWPSSVVTDRKATNKVCLTINLTAQHVGQVANQIRSNRPSIKVSPIDNNSDKKTAEIIGGLIRTIQSASSADTAHDIAAEHAAIGGEGYWRIVTEYESETSFNQEIKVVPCPDPTMVFIDPNAKAPDKRDAEWGFIFEDIPKSQAKREYPQVKATDWEMDKEVNGWVGDETVRRAEYFYCTREKDVACLLSDGTTALKSKLPEGAVISQERPTEIKKWKWCKLVGGHDKPVDEREWLGKYLPIIHVGGKELTYGGKKSCKGIVRDLKDPARMVNFSYSEAIQTVALQNKIPYTAAVESIKGYADVWKNANTDTLSYLPFNAYDAEGRPLPKPERQQAAVMPAAQMQLLQISTEEMRGASGQTASNFGIKSEAESGIGIQRLKQQGEVATFHFPDNLSRSLKYEAVVILDLIQSYYDTPRVVRILGLDGNQEQAMLDPKLETAYQERQAQVEGEVNKIFNPLVGKYDISIDDGPSYQTQRQEGAANLNELASRNPALMQVAGDLIMRSQDYPGAEAIADRLAKTLPPNLQDKPAGQQEIPPEVLQQIEQAQQQMQQMDGIIKQLAQENEQLKQGMQAKLMQAQAELQFKGQQAEADAQNELAKAAIAQETAIAKAKLEQQTKYEIAVMEAETERQIAILKEEMALHNNAINNHAMMCGAATDPEEPESGGTESP